MSAGLTVPTILRHHKTERIVAVPRGNQTEKIGDTLYSTVSREREKAEEEKTAINKKK